MLEHLRQVIGLRGYGQRDPLNEYKSEAFKLFEAMIAKLREAVTAQLMRVEIVAGAARAGAAEPALHGGAPHRSVDRRGRRSPNASLAPRRWPATATARARAVNPNDPTTWGKVGRNEACPCGSGKKYKHCHGRFG